MKSRRTPALLITALLAASCATSPPQSAVPASASQEALAAQRGFEETLADEALASHIYGALNADPIYYFRHVDVKVYRGVANLSGYVWSADAIYRARKITSGVPGVTRVETNQLQLERNGRDSGPAR
jgi:osmotically-inducible protein OsmY